MSGNEPDPDQATVLQIFFLKKSMLIFNRGLSLIPSFSCLINSTLWWTVLMWKNAENLRPISPQVVFTRSRWYEESDVVCVCCVGPNDSIISHIFRDIITLLACARSRPAMMWTLSHASDYLTLIVSANKAWTIFCFDLHLPDIDYPHCFATFLSFQPLFFFSYFCFLFMVSTFDQVLPSASLTSALKWTWTLAQPCLQLGCYNILSWHSWFPDAKCNDFVDFLAFQSDH